MLNVEITSGKINNKAQKVVIYGPEGIGKSTFAAHFPNPLFIDTEGSTGELDVRRLPAPTSWQYLMWEINQVKANPDICSSLIIDTADWAERFCINNLCEKNQVSGIEGFGYGKGYVYLEEEFGRFLNRLSDLIDLGINVVFTAHATMRKFEQPDESGAYDRWELKLQKKDGPLLKEWADMVLFANYETFVVKEGSGDMKKAKAKGGQGQKRSMDRASGSGVFSRDPDALLDLIELEIGEELLTQKKNEFSCRACIDTLDKYSDSWEDHVSQDDMCSAVQMKKACDSHLEGIQAREAEAAVRMAEKRAESLTAWRIEGTLREFPKFAPVNLWFDYPAHSLDQSGVLQDVQPDGDQVSWKRNFKKKKTPEDRKKEKKESVEMAYGACSIDGKVTLGALSEYMGVTEKTVRNRLKEHGGFWIDDGVVGKK